MSHVFKEETLEELSKVEDLTDFGEIEKNEHLLEDVEDEDAAAPDLFDPSSSLNSLNQFQDNDLIPDHEYLSFDNYENFVLEQSLPAKPRINYAHRRHRFKSVNCVVPECKSKFLYNLGVKLSSFVLPNPKNRNFSNVRIHWIYAMGFSNVEDLKIRENWAKVCELHFTEDCFAFYRPEKPRKTIKPGRYPTLNISVPECLQNDPRYTLLLEPTVTSDDEETDSADSGDDEREIVTNAPVGDSQVVSNVDVIASEIEVEEKVPKLVNRTDREYEEIVNQLSSSSSRQEETRTISIRDLETFRPPPLRVTYDKAGILAKLKESNLYPSKGYVKDGKLVGPPIGSVVPDTKVPLKKKKKYKERIQHLALTSGVGFNVEELEDLGENMPLRNIIDTKRFLSIRVDKNDVVVDKTSERVEQEIRRSVPKSLVITKTPKVVDKTGSEVSKSSTSMSSHQSLQQDQTTLKVRNIFDLKKKKVKRLTEKERTPIYLQSGVVIKPATPRTRPVQRSKLSGLEAKVQQGSKTNQDKTRDLFADDQVCKLLSDITPQKSEENKEIVLMRKSQASGLSPLGKPKLVERVVKQDGQVAKNTGDSSTHKMPSQAVETGSTQSLQMAPKVAGINLLSRGGTIIRPSKMPPKSFPSFLPSQHAQPSSVTPSTSQNQSSSTPGLFFKGNSTAKLLKMSQQQKKELIHKRFDLTTTTTSIGPANDHDYGKVVIPWRTDILTKEEAMYLKQEVERWKDEVETLKRKNQELQQNQPQLVKPCQYDHKKMEADLKMSNLEVKMSKKKIAKLEAANKKLQERVFLLRLDRKRMKIKERTRKYKRAKVVERRRRRRAWIQEQIDLGKMDKSQLHLAYSNKKLPCDLPKKASKTSIPEPEPEQEMEQQISDAITSIEDVDELSDVFTITTTTSRQKRENSENSAFRKSARNQKIPDPDPDMLISDKQLHFVHNDNAIIVTSFQDAGLSGLQDGSTEVSGLPSGSVISGGVTEYQDHMDFIVKAVDESDHDGYWKMEEREYQQQEY